ncbi:N-acetyltransferase [Salinarimonas sp.]|uniref:N-acetyltransferase n=1 Tax=Salinarimonas sp. TaxID=2766526 RepID=UPI0032D99F49
MPGTLQLKALSDIDLDDPFFDSLKNQYGEFPQWFAGKAASGEQAYVIYDEGVDELRGFLYLKLEDGPVTDVQPPLPAARRIKVGTFKIVAHGTKLGERAVKKIFDHAIASEAEQIYVTAFPTHKPLLRLLERYGFEERGNKITPNGEEIVLVKELTDSSDELVERYPIIRQESGRCFLLAIYPEFHTQLFPDSILVTEPPDILSDVSHTNTIHKVYVAGLPLTMMKKGDAVVIYRTTDKGGRARYRSVATSVCVVEETRSRRDFANVQEFVDYCLPHSVFSEEELRERFNSTKRLFTVRMTYNIAFPKRPNRDRLLDVVGLTDPPRFQFRRITDGEFRHILELAEVPARLLA